MSVSRFGRNLNCGRIMTLHWIRLLKKKKKKKVHLTLVYHVQRRVWHATQSTNWCRRRNVNTPRILQGSLCWIFVSLAKATSVSARLSYEKSTVDIERAWYDRLCQDILASSARASPFGLALHGHAKCWIRKTRGVAWGLQINNPPTPHPQPALFLSSQPSKFCEF